MQLSSFSKQQAHNLIEQLTPAQLSVVLGLMENIVDPHISRCTELHSNDELSDDTPPLRSTPRVVFRGRDLASDEPVRAEVGWTADASDFWPSAGQA